ncbi:Uncharacterised protein [Mycobacteroides abscessus subsp. abscessus]|nr:Uncharacterised protein [Mycobacteroides abscessus subsp. abscessus]
MICVLIEIAPFGLHRAVANPASNRFANPVHSGLDPLTIQATTDK